MIKILFIQTGGTIDKDLPRVLNNYAFEIDTPAVSRIIPRVTPHFTYSIKTAFRKDSNEITLSDRKLLKKMCEESRAKYIIITHGTDTMVKTAEFLSTIKDKIIILTGSIKPEVYRDTDADFNVGMAVGALQFATSGVYIAMSGRVYNWDNCVKREDCVFIEKKA